MSVKLRAFRSGGWEADIRVTRPDGSEVRSRKKAPVKSKSAAQRWAEAVEKEMLAHAVEEGHKAVPTVKEFAVRFIEEYAKANRQKPSTIDSKQRILRLHILPWFGEKRLDEVTAAEVQKFKAEKLAKKSDKTANNILNVLSKMLDVALDFDEISEVPVRIKLNKIDTPVKAFFEFDCYARIIETAEEIDIRKLVMTLLGGDAGLRRGEIIALRWPDIDFASKQITISRSDWNGEETLPKGGRKRHVPMTNRLIAALEELKHSDSVGDRVIHDGKGGRVAANSLHVWMATVLRRAKRPVRRGLHVLRHTFCSHLAMRGAPARVIQELAGHVTLTTTLGYMHLAKGAGHAAIALLDGKPNE